MHLYAVGNESPNALLIKIFHTRYADTSDIIQAYLSGTQQSAFHAKPEVNCVPGIGWLETFPFEIALFQIRPPKRRERLPIALQFGIDIQKRF
jgi:hypothetical protein